MSIKKIDKNELRGYEGKEGLIPVSYTHLLSSGAVDLCLDLSAQQGNHARPNSAGAGAFELFSGAVQGSLDKICRAVELSLIHI